jgi:hypothetical protein
MKAKKVVTIGGVTAAGGGMTLPIGRLSDSRWAGRVIGDHYRPIGPARVMCGADERVSSDGRADRWHASRRWASTASGRRCCCVEGSFTEGGECVRPEQTVSEMVEEVLERQAEAVVAQTGQAFEAALEEVAGTQAGRQLKALAESEYSEQRAAQWQASLPSKRIEERHYSWLESYMEWLESKEARSQYHALLEQEFANLRG